MRDSVWKKSVSIERFLICFFRTSFFWFLSFWYASFFCVSHSEIESLPEISLSVWTPEPTRVSSNISEICRRITSFCFARIFRGIRSNSKRSLQRNMSLFLSLRERSFSISCFCELFHVLDSIFENIFWIFCIHFPKDRKAPFWNPKKYAPILSPFWTAAYQSI